MSKLLTILLAFILIISSSLVGASSIQEPDDYYKLSGLIDYKKPCINSGSYCSSSAVCNITVLYPNQSIMISNQKMTNNYYYHNYTFPTLGICDDYCGVYKIDISCKDGSLNGTQTFYAEVNPTGIKPTDQRTATTGRATWIILLVSVLMFIGFLFLDHPSLKYSFLILSLIMLVTALNLTFNTLYNEVSDSKVIALFDFISAASFYFYWLAGGLLCIILIATTFSSIHERYKNVKLSKYGGDNGK